MDMPKAVETYFTAEKHADPEMLAEAFTAGAVVEDEGSRHQGRDAIRAWWLAAKAKYRHCAEPLETTRAGQDIVVRAEVSGDFPNSPAILRFAFTLDRDAIARLRIS